MACQKSVSNEEWALALVANIDPLRTPESTATIMSMRWNEVSFEVYALLLACCVEVATMPDLPDVCKTHLKNWRRWVHAQNWLTPAWLSKELVADQCIANADADGLTELAIALNPAALSPCLASGVSAVLCSPIWDDLEILDYGSRNRWPSVRRSTWWLSNDTWVIRIAHAGPKDTAGAFLTGYGSIYEQGHSHSAYEWRAWAQRTARQYYGARPPTRESVAYGLLKTILDSEQLGHLIVRLYRWWLDTKETSAFEALSLLTSLSNTKLAVILSILEETEQRSPDLIMRAFSTSDVLIPPADLVS